MPEDRDISVSPFPPTMLDDAPVDWVKYQVLIRAGVRADSELAKSVPTVHATDRGDNVKRTPTPFPAEGVAIKTVGEYFDTLDGIAGKTPTECNDTPSPEAQSEEPATVPAEPLPEPMADSA